jgi:WD40 repeat protein
VTAGKKRGVVSVFEVAIGPCMIAGKFRVDVLSSPDGGLASEVAALDVPALMDRHRELEHAVLVSGISARGHFPEEKQIIDVGRTLFTALLGTGEVFGRYRSALTHAQRGDEGLRVVLRTDDPALAALPWESMYDEGIGGYVCRRVELVRHVGVPLGVPPIAVQPPLRVLGIVSSPRGLTPLDVTREKEQLAKALAPLAERGLAELVWAPSAVWAELQDTLRSGTWHVVHFIGHGDFDSHLREGVLLLTGEDGGEHVVAASQLINLFRTAKPAPRLVVLNSCSGAAGSGSDLFAGTATALVRGGFCAVVAMQYRISDHAAINFSRGFYGAIACDRNIDEAVSDGRTAIIGRSSRTLEWVTPVLYLRGGESRLFVIKPPTRPSALAGSIGSLAASEPAPGPRSPAEEPLASRSPSVEVQTIHAHKGQARQVVWSPDGLMFASMGADDTIRLWNTATGAPLVVFVRESRWLSGAAFSPDSRMLACGDRQKGGVRLFAMSVTQMATASSPLLVDADSVYSFSLCENDINMLMSELRNCYRSEFSALAFLGGMRNYFPDLPGPSDSSFMSSARGVWNNVCDYLRQPVGVLSYRPLIEAALHDNPRNEVFRRAHGSIKIRAAKVSDIVLSWAGGDGSDVIGDVAFSPDGALLACSVTHLQAPMARRQRNSVIVWSVPDRRVTAGDHHFSEPKGIAYRGDGELVATGWSDGIVRLLSPSSGISRSLTGHTNAVNTVAFSPDNRLLASASTDGTVRLWDEPYDQPIRILDGFRDARSIAFSPDASLLAVAEEDGAQLWDPGTGTKLKVLPPNSQDPVLSVAFSPDGALLASSSQSGMIRLWE